MHRFSQYLLTFAGYQGPTTWSTWLGFTAILAVELEQVVHKPKLDCSGKLAPVASCRLIRNSSFSTSYRSWGHGWLQKEEHCLWFVDSCYHSRCSAHSISPGIWQWSRMGFQLGIPALYSLGGGGYQGMISLCPPGTTRGSMQYSIWVLKLENSYRQ